VPEGARLVRIDKKEVTEGITAELAAEWLRGEANTPVTLGVLVPGQEDPQDYPLVRQPVTIPSVERRILSSLDGATTGDIGYLKIAHFQDTTPQDVREALAQLQVLSAGPLRGLVLDLRGNPGGSVIPAVKVAELFLPEGVIVNMSSRFKDFDGEFRVRESVNPFALPMCVLVDGETASAAELLAGALKENNVGNQARAQLIGQTTFGKGSVQCIIPLEKSPGGIRITVAKFTSPHKKPFTNSGITPDYPVDPAAALMEAIRVLNEKAPPQMMRSNGMAMPPGM